MLSSRWPRSPSHGKCSKRFCGSSRSYGRSHHPRQHEAFDCHAFERNRQEECVQMPVKIARSTPRPSFGLPELLVASHISRLAFRDAAKSLLSTLVSESSGECRLIRFAFRIGDHSAAFQVHSLRRFIPASSATSPLTFKNLVRASGLYVGRAFPEVRCRQTQAVIPGPQIHDSWALPQWGRVRFNTANRGGSSCRLRYHYARILMRRSCGVWPGEAKMALKPDGFWRLRRSMTVRRAPRRPRSAVSDFRSSGTGCCASTPAVLTVS